MNSPTSKTTILGVLTIIAAVSNAAVNFLKTGTVGDIGEVMALVMGGYGLIKAADAK
jgi:hypothetical protein